MPGPERCSGRRGGRADLSRLPEAAAVQVEQAAERLRSVRAGHEYLRPLQYGQGSVLLEQSDCGGAGQ